MQSNWHATDAFLMLAAGGTVVIAALSYIRPVQSAKSAERPPEMASAIGSSLAAMPVLTAAGGVDTFRFQPKHRPTLVIFFRSTCEACERTSPIWKALMTDYRGRADLYAVSIEGTEVATDWLDRHAIVRDSLLLPAHVADIATKWHVPAVPITLVLSPDGVVRLAFVGVLAPAQLGAIRKMLGRSVKETVGNPS